MEQPLSFKDPEGHQVAGILALPTGKTPSIAVLCHGFLSSKNSTTNTILTHQLLSQGIATFRFDFFGHGDSQGPFEDITVTLAIQQARAALDLIRTQGFTTIGLVGSSFGGLVALNTAATYPNLSCLALKCPVVDFQEELRLELGESGLSEWKQSDTIPNRLGDLEPIRLSFRFFENCAAHIGYEAAPAITSPTLIVQGEQDELIPLHQCQRLLERLAVNTSLHLLPRADHRFSNQEDFRHMTTLIAQWLTLHLSNHAESGRS